MLVQLEVPIAVDIRIDQRVSICPKMNYKKRTIRYVSIIYHNTDL